MKNCSKCGEAKPEEAYAFKNKATGERRVQCRQCVSVGDKERYATSAKRRDDIIANNKRWLEKRRNEVRARLSAEGCIDCGIHDIRVLEYDHTEGTKTAGVMQLVSQGKSWSVINAEIAKCQPRCKNCHAIKTYERRGSTYADLI